MRKFLLFVFILTMGVRLSGQAQTQEQRKPVSLTFEEEQVIKEKTIFPYLDAIRHQSERRASSGRYSGMLTELAVSKTQSTPITVKKGEYLVLEAYAHYESTRNRKLLKNLALAVAAGVAASELNKAATHGEDNRQTSRNIGYVAGSAIAIPALIKYLKGKPQAMLLWQRYNNDRRLLEQGQTLVDYTAKGNWQLMKQFIKVSEDGYVIVYLVNKSKTPVWFDDVQLAKASDTPQQTNVPQQTNTTPQPTDTPQPPNTETEPKADDKEAKPEKPSYTHSTIALMTENQDAGCGDTGDKKKKKGDDGGDGGGGGGGSGGGGGNDGGDTGGGDTGGGDSGGPVGGSGGGGSGGPGGGGSGDSSGGGSIFGNTGGSVGDSGGGGDDDPPPFELPPVTVVATPIGAGTITIDLGGGGGGSSGGSSDGGSSTPVPTPGSGSVAGPGGPTGEPDCAGVAGGYAHNDDCGTCVGGTTRKYPFWYVFDNDHDGWGNSAKGKNCFNKPGADWVLKGGDINDNCYDPSNGTKQCYIPNCDELLQGKVSGTLTAPGIKSNLKTITDSLSRTPIGQAEQGLVIYQTTAGAILPGREGIQSGNAANLQVNISVKVYAGSSPIAYVHTHPAEGYEAPSGGDVFQFLGLNAAIPTVATAYVIGADGDNYAMVIDDPAKVAAFLALNPPSSAFDPTTHAFTKTSQAGQDYDEAYKRFSALGLPDAQAYELAMAYVLDQAGIKLLKAPYLSDEFKALNTVKNVDANGNATFITKDCY